VFLGDEAERLLEHLVLAEPEQLGNRVVGLKDLAFEVGNEYGVRRLAMMMSASASVRLTPRP